MKAAYIPNILSVVRLLTVPCFVAVFFWDYPDHAIWALLIFAFAGATDIVDGYLAGHFNWITNVGKLLDPLADKSIQLTVLICLTVKGIVPIYIACLFVAKELFMIVGAAVVLGKINVTVKSNWYGKAASVLFYAVTLLSIILVLIFRIGISPLWTNVMYLPVFAVMAAVAVFYVLDILSIKKKLDAETAARAAAQ